MHENCCRHRQGKGVDVVAIEIGKYVLDDARFELRCGGERVPAQPKVVQSPMHLAGARERMVSNEELLRAVWPQAATVAAK
jgi:DNA-binding response OmpR family regulator